MQTTTRGQVLALRPPSLFNGRGHPLGTDGFGRSDFRAKVRVLLASARDGAAFNPDFNPVGAFEKFLR